MFGCVWRRITIDIEKRVMAANDSALRIHNIQEY